MLLGRPALHVKHPEKAEAVQTDQDQVDCDNKVEKPRHDQDQNASEQSYNGRNMRSGNRHLIKVSGEKGKRIEDGNVPVAAVPE